MKQLHLSVLAVMLTLVTSAAAGTLDGQSFVGEVGKIGDSQSDTPDELIFADGRFRSTDCDQYGFSSAEYTSETVDGKVQFSTTTRSDDGTMIVWKGTIDGRAAEATFTWIKERRFWFDVRQEYWFKGTRK